MKKYILTSVMSLFLVLGAGLMLTATETEPKKETAKSCCSTAATTETAQAVSTCTGVEKTQTAAAATKSNCADKSADAACCSSKESKATKANAESGDVKMIQTSSAAKSDCTSSAASCTGSKTTQVAGPQPGECTKVPSGIKSQQASREN